MNSRYLPVALILVGGMLLASSGWLWTDIRECRNTQSIMVEPEFNGPEYDIEKFETLSDRQQGVFLRAVNATESYIEAERDVSLPGAVKYQNTTYRVESAHADDCGRPVGDFLVWGGFVIGVGSLVAGVFRRR